MNIAITGSAGLVGSALISKLVKNPSNNITSFYHQKPPTNKSITSIQGDLVNYDDCMSLLKDQDMLIHCAARTFGAEIMSKEPLSLSIPNIIMNTNLIEAAYQNGVKQVIFMGSTTAYPASDDALSENTLFQDQPYKSYFVVGNVKRITEILGTIYSDSQLKDRAINFTSMRLTNVYGPHDKFDPKKSHVLPALLKRVVDRMDPFEVWGDGQEVRDFIYVDDAVSAIEHVMEHSPQGTNAYNIGSGVGCTVNDIMNKLFELENFHPEINRLSDKPSMIPFRMVNVDKAKQDLGWQSSISLEEGLRKTLTWYKENLQ